MKKVFLLLAGLLMTSLLPASTITVTTINDEDDNFLGGGAGISLREAIIYSMPGDVIILANTTYTLSLVNGSDPESTNIVPGTRDLDVQHNLTINGNGATIDAGDIDRILQVASGVTVMISEVNFTNGTARHFYIPTPPPASFPEAFGGGIHNAGNLTLTNCTINNCITSNSTTSNGHGGGIYNTGTLEMTDCTVSGNQSGVANFGNQGGGIYTTGTSLTMNKCTVANNQTNPGGLGSGGGIFIDAGTVDIVNSTISGNTAAGRFGGGISISGGTSTTIDFCTITNNISIGEGGGLHTGAIASSVSNTLIAGNSTSADAEFSDLLNEFGSSGYNLVGIKPDANNLEVTDQFGTAGSPLDPNLGSLQNNGGATQTHMLLNLSPAYNAANPSTTVTEDQTGSFRPQQGRADVGAYESSVALPVELISFRGRAGKDGVQLLWATALETNNTGFEVQRLKDGTWQQLGFVESLDAMGEEQQYSFLDDTPEPGLNYYRLKQVDIDGSFEYSGIVTIDFVGKVRLQLSPNPVQDELRWSIPALDSAVKEIQIFDQPGHLLKQRTNPAAVLNLVALPKGIYYLRVITTDGQTWTEPFIKR